MNITEFIAGAIPGDQYVYHTGFHCGGREREVAMVASNDGLVCLTQKRAELPGTFEYTATRTNKAWQS